MLLWKELNICEWIVLAEDERALCCMFHSDKKARFPHAERFFYIPPLFSAQHQILQDRVALEQVLLISLPCYLLVTIVLLFVHQQFLRGKNNLIHSKVKGPLCLVALWLESAFLKIMQCFCLVEGDPKQFWRCSATTVSDAAGAGWHQPSIQNLPLAITPSEPGSKYTTARKQVTIKWL